MPTGKGPLRIAIEDFLETFSFGERVRNWIKSILELWENEAIDAYQDLVNLFELEKYLPENITPQKLRELTKHQVALVAVLLPLLWQVAQMIAQLFVTPFMRPLNYLAEAVAHTKHADAPTVLQMLRKRPDLEQKLRSILITSGFDEISLEGYNSLIDQFLTAFQYEQLKLRGTISESEAHSKLLKIGIREEDISGLDELVKVIPSVTELITLQVREAFNDAASQKFQHDEGDISQVAEWAEKQGLSAEWVKRFWRAHWVLPGANQVFEMLQRLRPGTTDNPVTTDDVSTYLQMADYSPFWRSRMAEISYLPFTRVDIRRMYKTGVLNEVQVKDAYLDAGYNDERAQALTEFTIAYEAEEETGIVRSSVISAYKSGMIDRGKAEEMLKGGGYDDTTIAFYLDNVDFQNGLEVNQIKLNNIHRRFVEGLIDESSVNSEINHLNLPGERVTALLELWTTERENQIQLPTLTQIENFYEMNIVTIDDFKRILKRRGYTDETINWNLQRIDIEKATKAQNDAEKAQADNERLQKSNTASKYQKDKAEIDLAIAQSRAELTDIAVALHNTISDEELSALKTRTDDLKLFIAQANVAKAQLRFDTQTALQNLGGTSG